EYSQNYRKDYSNTDNSRTNYHYSSKAKHDNYNVDNNSIDNENNYKHYSKSGNALAKNRGMMQKTGINTTIPYALMILLIAISAALMKLKNMQY
ncbi:exo-alpha-sialidase, partial [Bifidobacteriaceae bacterium NR026]